MTTPLKTVSVLQELLKAYRAIAVLKKEEGTSPTDRRPLAGMYLRNKVDQWNIQLEVAMWDDWEKDREVAADGAVTYHFQPKLYNMANPADANTLYGTILARATAEEEALGGEPLVGFRDFVTARVLNFVEAINRIEQEPARADNYIRKYIDREITFADTARNGTSAVTFVNETYTGNATFVPPSVPM